MFSLSGHPNISPFSLPRPQEWSFVAGENVTIRSLERKGRITLIEAHYAEVEIPEEGLHLINWHDIRKYFEVGDFVCVAGGPNRNAAGWVIECKEDVAIIADKTVQGEIDKKFDEAIQVSYYRSYLIFILTKYHRRWRFM